MQTIHCTVVPVLRNHLERLWVGALQNVHREFQALCTSHSQKTVFPQLILQECWSLAHIPRQELPIQKAPFLYATPSHQTRWLKVVPNIFFFKITIYLYVGSFATVCLWKSEANLRELVFFLLCVAWGLNSKVKCLYLMSILSATNF